jgi:hypothetical protein
MSHPFEEGKTYRNRVGEYVVQSLDGDRMTIRYVGGKTLETRAAIQARIWENIQFEEQAQREEERRKLAQEARLEARKRSARAKKQKAMPKFEGFQESDFEAKKRGIAWSSREELGRAVAHELNQRTGGAFAQWIVPRQSRVHIARKAQYDRDRRDTNATFAVTVSDQGLTYGFYVGKPDGRVSAKWPWSNLLKALDDDDKLRRAVRAAIKSYDLILDVYAEDRSYGRVGQITAETRGFLWQHETEEQAETKRMTWNDLLEYLQTVAPERRSGIYLQRHIPADAALDQGTAVAEEISDVFESLLPVYDASVGV